MRAGKRPRHATIRPLHATARPRSWPSSALRHLGEIAVALACAVRRLDLVRTSFQRDNCLRIGDWPAILSVNRETPVRDLDVTRNGRRGKRLADEHGSRTAVPALADRKS